MDDSWLESVDEDYLGEEGVLGETAMYPLVQAQGEADETEDSSVLQTASLTSSTLHLRVSTLQPPEMTSTPSPLTQVLQQGTTSPLATSTPTSSSPATPPGHHQTTGINVHPFQLVAFTEQVCPVNPLGSDATPLDYFQQMFGETTFAYLADQTNLYAQQNPPGESHKWTPTCPGEIQLLLGILLTMGIHRLPDATDYWSQNHLLGVPCISKCMPVTRFKALLRCLHLNDNSTALRPGQPGFDKLHKLRPLYDTLHKNCSTKYKAHRENSVDEAMVIFKGKSSFKQYMPSKPVKRGIRYG